MKLSRQELERLIKEELRESLEQYPADAMAEITATIFSLADEAGVETTGDEREDIVGEIEELLRGQGFELHEQGLVFDEPLHLDLGGTQLGDLMLDIRDALPGAWNTMLKAFERGGINTGLPLEPSVTDFERSFELDPEEDDEDLISTIVVPPVSPPDDEDDEEDQTDTVVVPPVGPPPEDDEDLTSTIVTPPVDVPEEEEPPLKVGDIVRVKENDISGIEPGDYEVADIYAGPKQDPQPWVLLTAEDGEGGYRDHLSLIVDNPEFFKINPLLPKIKNPWAFKWFWEEDEEDEEDQPDWMKKAVKGIKGVLGGSSTSIKTLVGVTGIAGIVALMKYLAKDEEKINEAAALQKGKDLEELGEVEPWAPGFITSTLKFALSLALDKEQMETIDLVDDVIQIGTSFVFSDDSDRQEEIDVAIYKALDKVPGIEWIDKLPGGRERTVEIIRERWDEMSPKEKISLVVALLPQDIVVKLEALIPGPDLSEMDMRWPEVEPELSDWFAEGGVDHNKSFEAWDNLPGLLLNAGEMFGLLDRDQTEKAMAILFYADLALQDAKDDSNAERMMKVMDALFEHKKQSNRMKVLAGVK